MSERGYGGGITRNPVYGGSELPAWPKSNNPRTNVFSDIGGSTPPDSPRGSTRSGHAYRPPQYEHPGYTVETPGRNHNGYGASPYRPPTSYYVQTPARSERASSPASSAPSSPTRSANGHGNNFDVQSVRSGRSGTSNPGNRRTLKAVEEDLDDEEAALKKDEEPPKKRRKYWRLLCILLILTSIVVVVAGCIACWYIFQPSAPTFTFDGVTMWNLQAQNKLAEIGLPTDMLTMNVSMQMTMHNVDSRFSSYCDGGVFQVGYSSINPLMQAGVPHFSVSTGKKTPFSASASIANFPLYGAGPGFRQNVATKVLPLTIQIAVHSHIEMVWKIVQTYYTHIVDCTANFNPVTLAPINNTCVVQRVQ